MTLLLQNVQNARVCIFVHAFKYTETPALLVSVITQLLVASLVTGLMTGLVGDLLTDLVTCLVIL